MPSLVVIISLLSFLSLIHAVKLFNQEVHRLTPGVHSYVSNIDRLAGELFRLSLAAVFTLLSLLCMMMSVALIWLSIQPAAFG